MPRRRAEQPSSGAGDGRRSTIRDVASRAGVSVATVSRVLAGNYPTAPATRISGYSRALADRGLEPLIRQGEHGTPFGYRTVKGLLREGPFPATAIVAADDSCAAGAVLALREGGLRIPEDISIVGYDDVPMAAHMWPPLTTVHIPAEELGRAAVRMALHPSHSRETILGTHIVVRQSVARRVA